MEQPEPEIKVVENASRRKHLRKTKCIYSEIQAEKWVLLKASWKRSCLKLWERKFLSYAGSNGYFGATECPTLLKPINTSFFLTVDLKLVV